MNELTAPWFNTLIEDCLDIAVETEFTHNWALVEGRHLLGTRILEDNENFERENIYGEKIVQCIAQSIKRSRRTVYYSMKFASLYPDLNILPSGKNISWTHIINKYLTAGEEKPVRITPTEMIRQIKQLLQHEWLIAHQDFVERNDPYKQTVCEFIRYLQDQVNKITGGLNES